MSTGNKFIYGLLIGLFITMPLLAISYLAEVTLGVPFVPFDVFDIVSRELPGDVVTFGIDTMVDTIRALELGETDDTAKLAEQWMATFTVLGIGMVLSVGFFLLIKNIFPQGKDFAAYGIGYGLIVGIIFALASSSINVSATANETVSFIWIVATFLAWGVALGFAYQRLQADPTPEPATVQKTSRRQFLIQAGGTTAAITVFGVGLAELLADEERIEGGDVDLTALREEAPTVEPAPGTRPEYTPLEDHYRIDINSGRPPNISEDEWELKFTGLVNNPRSYKLADIRDNYEPVYQVVTLSCISNRIAGDLISTTQWTGVPVRQFLEEVGLQQNATHLLITSADGFFESVEIDMIMNDERIIFAYEFDGVPLPVRHGFPLRIYIPDRYGMKQPKWITEIEAMNEWVEGYWVRRNWSREAIVRTTSVIDTVAVNDVFEENGQTYVPIGGIAYSGAKGISKVEVRVDDGEWEEARLREPLSPLTWVIWRYDWPMQEGEHTFEVRCYDGSGEMQITERNGNRPDGATGIHTVTETV
jgi:DMSO/TMAO reductase YedYZ molybdopterin-dependent catalytic subunit